MKATFLLTAACSLAAVPALAVTDNEAEKMRAEIDALNAQVSDLKALVGQLESTVRHLQATTYQQPVIEERLDQVTEYETSSERNKVAGTTHAEKEREEERAQLDFGGAVWVNYAYQEFKSPDEGNKRDLYFDNLRLSLDGSYAPEGWEGNYYFSAQHRFYSYTDAIHHAFIGYEFEEDHKLEIGITQVPFGLLPFASHSFWFGIGYYLGQEDDYDAGVKYQLRSGNWNLHAAYFLNEELGDASNLGRYSVDLVRLDEQQNEERDQFNLRGAYTITRGDATSEIGLSGEYGAIDNLNTEHSGHRWAAAAHFNGLYGRWNPQLQVGYYQYDPENPADVDDSTVRMGNLESYRDIAAEGTVISANLAYRIPLNWGQFTSANCYNDYSTLLKEESGFNDSQLNVTGCVFEGGPFWIWADIINGKNAWYLDDSSQFSGLGAGAEDDDWKTRFNVNLEWYF